jgi:hypothetical protein
MNIWGDFYKPNSEGIRTYPEGVRICIGNFNKIKRYRPVCLSLSLSLSTMKVVLGRIEVKIIKRNIERRVFNIRDA